MTPPTSLPATGWHILIIGDRPGELQLLVHALRGGNFRLSIAFNGAQGYDRALALRPDLILLDLQMPRMDGFAVARMLKANPITATIPILFILASIDHNSRLTGLRAGAVDYVLKPFSPEEVLERVNIHLRLSGVMSDEPDFLATHACVGSGDDRDVLVRAVGKYLFNDLANPPRLKDLADTFGVSERKLVNAFQRRHGVTVFEFVRQERMRKAQSLLAETMLSITTIADEIGFSSAANFSTAFRDYLGTSPSSFRKDAFKQRQQF